jgi:hypothetical protein
MQPRCSLRMRFRQSYLHKFFALNTGNKVGSRPPGDWCANVDYLPAQERPNVFWTTNTSSGGMSVCYRRLPPGGRQHTFGTSLLTDWLRALNTAIHICFFPISMLYYCNLRRNEFYVGITRSKHHRRRIEHI